MSALARPPVRQRPRTVVFAACFTGISAAAFVVRLVVRYAQPPHTPFYAELFWVPVCTGLGALWAYGIWSGRNWVRWITIVYGVLDILAIPRASARFYGLARPAFWVEAVFLAAAAAVLVLPSARGWYARSAEYAGLGSR